AYRLRALITDAAGNTYLTPTVSATISNTALKGTLATVASYIGKTVQLEGTATSTGPAVASWTVQRATTGSTSWSTVCTKTSPTSGSEYSCELDTTTLSDGEYQLRVIVTDTSGDTYTTPLVATNIDNTPPIGSLDNLPQKVAGNIEVHGHAYDSGSGVATWTLQIALAGSETFTEACLSQSVPIFGLTYGCTLSTTSLENGSYQLRAVITDNVGRTYTTPVISMAVDNSTLTSTAAP